jgi:hypothetical protein
MFTSDLVAGNFYTLEEAQAAEASGKDKVSHSSGDATGLGQGAFGESIVEGMAPQITQEQRDRVAAGNALRNAQLGVDAQGNQLPAYGTPQAQGGTASGFQVTSQPTVGTGTQQIQTQQLGASGEPLVGSTVYDRTMYRDADTGASVSDGQGGLIGGVNATTSGTQMGDAATSKVIPGEGGAALDGAGGGSRLLGQTNDQTQLLRADLDRRQGVSQNQTLDAADRIENMNPLVNRNLTQTAANQAGAALGPAATVQQSLVDRKLGSYEQGQRQTRQVLDQLMNGPSTTDRIGSQVLRNQLALARSAGGGAGAQQAALANAQAQAPELQAQATQQAVQENVQRQQAAGQLAQQTASTALGARGQDIDVAKSNQAAGMRLTDNIAQLTGQQLQINQQSQEQLGRMFTDMAKQDFEWGKLNAEQQQAELERWAKVYGIDQTVMAQLKVAALANPEKGFLDYARPVIGGLTSLAGAVI